MMLPKLCLRWMILPTALTVFTGLFVAMRPSAVLAGEAPSLKDSVPAITTMGEAHAEAVPDIAIMALGIVTERPKAAEAARENARAAQALIDSIKAQGI